MHSIKSCFCSSKPRYSARFKDHAILAAETTFNVNEVEALHVLFEQLSRSIIDDGLIHKEEFKLALINSKSKNNLFADRLFELFDLKKNGVIEFEEFVKSLSIFHPNTLDEDKIAFAFRLYDLNHTGYIERDELKEMVSATLSESDLYLSDDAVETIVEKTLWEVDLNGDGKIDLEEWKEMVARNPSLIKNMTLPYLREITLAFPHFVMTTEVPDSKLVFQTAN
ncbi:calcineurin B-like protein 7 [Olea europaea var. sylvestris]|uniref:Calcineurin B-like protein n=1 Tax=Olea europaea subsp. europaea TaxID=158383 RepID=A0A8S0PSV3_OLEEU|nr:calcineurin B-like protein 7 [Olea europaea var. sylvestris]XP_022886980.1 calcineurin B-like protein 7 [Olea europaea var. sylvestris]CAA2956663.1 calcineurin B 4 [Olea europaea subsp. europaea]